MRQVIEPTRRPLGAWDLPPIGPPHRSASLAALIALARYAHPLTLTPMLPRGPYRTAQTHQLRPYRLQARDLSILAEIAVCRVLTQDLLVWLFPPQQSEHLTKAQEAAQAKRAEIGTATSRAGQARPGTNLGRRLQKLHGAKYVDWLQLVTGGPRVWMLTGPGATLLRTDDVAEALRTERPEVLKHVPASDWDEKNRRLSTPFVLHALGTARVYAGLTAATRATDRWTLDRFTRDSDETQNSWTDDDNEKWTLRPDAFLLLKSPTLPEGKNRLAFFLEADRSTMDHLAMVKKYHRYVSMFRHSKLSRYGEGINTASILTVAKSKRRAEELAKLVAAPASKIPDEMKKLFFFTSDTEFLENPANLLAMIWTRAHRPTERAAIIPSPLKAQ